MNICIATTDPDIEACYQIMQELRPHIARNEFVARVRNQEKSGYQLVFVEDRNDLVAVAGFRVSENLAWGRFLYIDDLVTAANYRSNGYGAKLLAWLREYAVKEGCCQLHLDSGFQREDAHRFYERESLSKNGFHFAVELGI
jgi:GNAT superfamily N-acetyltransferase